MTPDPLRAAAGAIKAEHDRDGHREPCALCAALAADTAPMAPTPPDPLRAALEPFDASGLAYWKRQLTRDRTEYEDWSDEGVMELVSRFLATLAADAAPREHCPSCDVEHDWDWRLAKERG